MATLAALRLLALRRQVHPLTPLNPSFPTSCPLCMSRQQMTSVYLDKKIGDCSREGLVGALRNKHSAEVIGNFFIWEMEN